MGQISYNSIFHININLLSSNKNVIITFVYSNFDYFKCHKDDCFFYQNVYMLSLVIFKANIDFLAVCFLGKIA